MSYLVLARKWRPRDFQSLVGQEHVVRALTNALSTQRLHHAWLFTGTRGVGKTTLSRILAKSLNCETGVTATPCGQCRACTEIDGGRFVDYVELDAASNRGVAEMTQLLEQAVYSPAVGRFKVYMIDEVHMLSGHAFNAMLKTLEEPPPHVKFILATTDPQKIPPTVLSRCLQFNLKQMAPEAIAGHLSNVLTAEKISFDPSALKLIGQSASGSMRDALSLTDQAIAYSGSDLTLEAVRGMLGAVDQTHLIQLLQALAQSDAAGVLAVADALSVRGISFRAALSDLAVLLSRVSICQHVGVISDDADPMAAAIESLAQELTTDLVQLFYTVAVHGRQELSLAPDEYAGFVMVCLKMLAFSGGAEDSATTAEKKNLKPEVSVAANNRAPILAAVPAAPAVLTSAPVASPAPSVVATEPAQYPQTVELEPQRGPLSDSESDPMFDLEPAFDPEHEPRFDPEFEHQFEQHLGQYLEPRLEPEVAFDTRHVGAAAGQPSSSVAKPILNQLATTENTQSQVLVFDDKLLAHWPSVAAQLPVTGMAQQLATQSACLKAKGDEIVLQVSTEALAQGQHVERLKQVLQEKVGSPVKLTVSVGQLQEGSSAQMVADEQARQRQLRAQQTVANDSFVKTLISEFGGQILPGSVKAIEPTDRSVS